jgi:acyl-homoserine-lactone acylase
MWDMARARNLAEFQKALQRQQLPMFTVIYADRDGHIMHLFNGRVPVRSRGDFRFWQGIVPGDTSATLWTRFHPYRELPKVIDPSSGWLQNANSPPWVATFPPALDPSNYPPYMAPRFMSFREQHSARMLDGDRRISFQELLDYKHSTRLELADRILDDLIAAAREHGGPLAREAADVLRSWDRRAEAASRGAVLFITWHQEMQPAGRGWPTGGDSDNLFATPWEERNPRTTPRGLADPRAAAKSLEAAAVRVKAAYGALDVPFGEVFRLRRGGIDLPGNGAPDPPLGTFRVIDYAPAGPNRFQSFGGDSSIAAVEFSNPVRAMALVSYGNASQPGSPHNGDQLRLAARKELRPVCRSRAEIEAHLESRTVLPDQ